MTSIPLPPVLEEAFTSLRVGDDAAAILILQDAARSGPLDAATRGLLGMLLCRSGRVEEGIAELQIALAQKADDSTARANLAIAMLTQGRTDDAWEVVSGHGDTDIRLRRVEALILHERREWGAARRAYEDVVAILPNDFEAWNNLGTIGLELRRPIDAIAALRRAIALRPMAAMIHLNLSRALAAAERHDERVAGMRAAASRFPDDASVFLELGLAEAAIERFDDAEQALVQAAKLDPANPASYVELTLLYDNLNRLDDLDALADDVVRKGVPPGEAGFVRAWALRRRGCFREALTAAEAVPDTIAVLRRHQLIAGIVDRLDMPERAFAAYTAMNAAVAQDHPIPAGERSFLEDVRETTARIEQSGEVKHGTASVSGLPVPILIAGFPRSGTTLLDTLLMNVPGLHVLEEKPAFDHARMAIGSRSGLSTLDHDAIERGRKAYHDAVMNMAPPPAGSTIVDKHPFHMVRMDLIHRLFPTAKIILIERHPCDVVLSCFMQTFQPNRAMRAFTTLTGAAELYDASYTCWQAALSRLALDVHVIRYEQMIADLPGEMRRLLDFLDIEWTDAVLDNQTAAGKRRHIATASYAQVGEPIYSRAIGRFHRYREQMASVLPILAPWAKRLGYEL
jgi:Flp pilus assembly protein TadD